MTENIHDHFTLPAIFSVLLESALKHDKEAVKVAAGFLGMTPTTLLRGVSYMSSLVNDSDDDLPMQHQFATSTLSELTGLVAVLLELDCYGDAIRQIEMRGDVRHD